MTKLSAAQRAMLQRVSQCPDGLAENASNRTLVALARRNLVRAENIRYGGGYNRFRRSYSAGYDADWVLTKQGRKLLAEQVLA